MYVWLKAFHVIAIIAWMAGMLYLPRLFVYHCEAEPGSKQSETFKVMERRLLHAIITPAMVASWALGLWLAWAGGFYAAGWLHATAGCMPSWCWLSRSPLCMVSLCAACANSPLTAIAILNNSIGFSMRYRPFS